MSRIGKLPVKVPKGVNITLNEQTVKVKGPHGELSQLIPKEISVSISDDTVTVSKNEETIKARQNYGLIRSLVNNMVIGVSEKFEKKMQMIGVGYRAQVQGKKINLQLGFSHDISYEVPEGIKVEVEGDRGNVIAISGPDKQVVGQVASEIRSFRKPEPYKGKGVKYVDEQILRKEGKKK